MLTLEHVRSASAHRERTIELPLLGESARVRLFTKRDLDEIRAESVIAGELDQPTFERLLLMRGLIEPALDDACYLSLKDGNAAVFYSLLNAVVEGNGLTALAARDTRRTFPA